MNNLNAISPIDGRYYKKTAHLSKYFSESALIHYRVKVEVEYLIELANLLGLKGIQEDEKLLREGLKSVDVEMVKHIEKTTNHDVKAVEYYIKNCFPEHRLEYLEWVHFGLTSQDINNTAIPLMIKDWLNQVYIPQIESIVRQIEEKSNVWSDIPMLARTHGQPASPTRLGKEFAVFVERLSNQIDQLKEIKIWAKFGGATGNFNAHKVAYPNIDWVEFADNLISKLGLVRQKTTTQIEHYDGMAQLFDNLKRINTILVDLCQDIWQYVSLDYFKQSVVAGEVGSSAMPHKVNPIDFENAEGNLSIANAILAFLSSKLPISRLQRDLTDSTVLRNIGVPIGHIAIALDSIEKGLSKLMLNQAKINQDLENNWLVVAEAIQTILRREGYPNPYETLKTLTRGQEITQKVIHQFIDTLDVSDSIKFELKLITPHNYTGI